LLGKRVAHCLTGSVSIYRAPEISRALIRHGCGVIPVMTREAARLLNPRLMEWATGVEPLVEVTGRVEHVELTEGDLKADLVLVAPASANTIVKISLGISDNAVTLLCSAALGAGVPLVIAPAMHASMMSNPAVSEALRRLELMGVSIVAPIIEEAKAKLAPYEQVVEEVIYRLTPKPLAGRRFVVTAGPTREFIDPVRFISNPSTGTMGVEVARTLRYLGGDVELILGPTHVLPPYGVRATRVVTASEMERAVIKAVEGAEALFSAAAVSDYRPSNPSPTKIETHALRRLTLELEATPKILESARRSRPDLEIIPFKAIYGAAEEPEKVAASLSHLNPIITVINDVSRRDIGFASPYNEVIIVTRSGKIHRLPRMLKSEAARRIAEIYLTEWGSKRGDK